MDLIWLVVLWLIKGQSFINQYLKIYLLPFCDIDVPIGYSPIVIFFITFIFNLFLPF